MEIFLIKGDWGEILMGRGKEEEIEGKIFSNSKEKTIFAPTDPTTPLNDAYHGGT